MSRLTEIKWYLVAAVFGWDGIVWPSLMEGQSEIRITACLILMFVSFGIGDIIRAVSKRKAEPDLIEIRISASVDENGNLVPVIERVSK